MIQQRQEEVAALREEIRRAGELAGQLRTGFRIVTWVFFSFGGLLMVGALAEYGPAWFWSGSVALVFILAALPAALTALVRGLLRNVLRRHAQLCPAPSCAEELSSLQRDPCKDTRQLAAGLVRQLRRPTELTPAETLAGRGDEASAVEGWRPGWPPGE